MRQFDALPATIDLNLLPLFVLVAELGSFAQAAQRLRLERSSVSRGVATLERALGVQLFSRTTRRVALTSAGADLYDKVSPQLASLKASLSAVPEREQEPSGLLRLTATTDIGAIVLPAAIAGFSRRFPNVTFELQLRTARIDLVAQGIDAALRIGVPKLADSTLMARRLGDISVELYASASYVARTGDLRTVNDLAQHRILCIDGFKFPEGMDAPPLRNKMVADDFLFLCGAAEEGMGVALLPTFAAQNSVTAGRLVRVLPKISLGTGTLYFVHPPATHVPRKVSALRDYLVDYIAAHPLGAQT